MENSDSDSNGLFEIETIEQEPEEEKQKRLQEKEKKREEMSEIYKNCYNTQLSEEFKA